MGRTMAVVVFTDLVGSTELRGRLGEEAAEELRRRHDKLLADAVEGHGGRVVKGLGDGIMATFAGAADAVAAAVAIQQGIDRLNRTGRAVMPLAVRVGLSAGDVSFEDDDVHGTPVIEASRLCAAAGGDDILVSEIVRLLAGLADEDLGDRGRLALKGLQKPVAAWEVRWEPVAVSTIPMPALLTDVGRIFVGRDAELERLAQLWKEAAAGERRVALLAGEPGVGKTRLAAELATRVHEEGGVVLAGRCDEDMGVPYQPFVEALRHYIDYSSSAELKERLGRYGAELTRLVPELPERVPGLPAPLQSDPQTERYRLFDAVAAWLSAASAEDSLFVVLDDLQWAAKPTLLLLRHVVRASDVNRVLILGTYRDTELTHDHPLVELVADLRREAAVERLPLSGLDDLAVAAVVEQTAGQVLDEEGAALARAIYQETEGNPFFVREVLRHLAETNAIAREGGRWRTLVPTDQLGIPEGVRDVVGRRLSRLSEEAHQALRVAAVVGTEFDLAVVRSVEGVEEEQLLSALDEAVSARLVTEVSATRYRFAHALVRATLYEALTAARKVATHRRVALAIETLYAEALDDQFPALAHHWAQTSMPAADTARAVGYARKAGDRALAQLAHDEAVRYYRHALELLGSAEDPHGGERLQLLISLGEAERLAGDAHHRQTLLDAAAAARAGGDADALARAALANNRGALWSIVGTVDPERVEVLEAALDAVGHEASSTRARLLANLALELIWVGDRQRRLRLSDEALAMARRLGDPRTLGHVLANRAYAIAAPSTLDDRFTNSAELVSLSERLGDPVMASRAWSVRFRAAMEASDIEEADRCLEACERLATELNQPGLRWVLGMHRTGRTLLAGDLDTAEQQARETLELGRTVGQLDASTLFSYQLIRIRHEQGRMNEITDHVTDLIAALPKLTLLWSLLALAWAEVDDNDKARDAYEHIANSGFKSLRLDSTWLIGVTDSAAVCAHLADAPRAASLRDLLAPYARQMPVGSLGTASGSVWHYLGLLATTLGDFDEAEGHFTSAASTHTRIGAPTWLARTRLEWARMLLTRRQPRDDEPARELLSQALATARELGLAKVERDAVALLQ